MSAEHVLAYLPLTGPVPDGLLPGQPFVHERVKVGPKLAAALLDNQAPYCRPISPQHVERYAADMTRGEWEYRRSDEVRVNNHGQLIGGRCVLSAVVMSGREIEADVWHNVQPVAVPDIETTEGSSGDVSPQ